MRSSAATYQNDRRRQCVALLPSHSAGQFTARGPCSNNAPARSHHAIEHRFPTSRCSRSFTALIVTFRLLERVEDCHWKPKVLHFRQAVEHGRHPFFEECGSQVSATMTERFRD